MRVLHGKRAPDARKEAEADVPSIVQEIARPPLLADQDWFQTLNLIGQAPRLEVPVYFMAGRYDYKTPGVLAEEYLNGLDAPAGKRMFWFENSAHVPFIEEREPFHSAMIETILAEVGG